MRIGKVLLERWLAKSVTIAKGEAQQKKTIEGLGVGKGKKDSRSPATIAIACVKEMVKGVDFLPWGYFKKLVFHIEMFYICY